jgi:hypothetical protein
MKKYDKLIKSLPKYVIWNAGSGIRVLHSFLIVLINILSTTTLDNKFACKQWFGVRKIDRLMCRL